MKNTPYLTSTNASPDNSEDNPFFDEPYIPGYPNKGTLNNLTLPIYA